MKRCFVFSVILVAGCAVDQGDDELATADQSSTVLDQCAVGHAANATGLLTSIVRKDSYGRSANTLDLIGTGRCDCIDWQGVFDVEGQAVADAMYPTCRPDAIYEITVNALSVDLAHFTVFSEFTDKVHTHSDCANSNLHMELWRYTSTNVWQKFWGGTQTAKWDAGRCYQTVGEASPNLSNGLYRVKAVATPAGEQGYDGIVISGGLL